MSKHTPGPWEHQTSAGDALRIKAPSRVVCFMPERSNKSWDEITANAALMAVAPEMLAALEKGLSSLIETENMIHSDDLSPNLARENGQCIDQMRKAIAKARGAP